MFANSKRFFRGSLVAFASGVLAASVIGFASPVLMAAEGAQGSKAFDPAGMMLFPDWQPLFEEQKPVAPKQVSEGKTAIETEEIVTLAPAETLDEAIRVAALKVGVDRKIALGTLWNRYEHEAIFDLLLTRIEKRGMEDAVLACEILLQGSADAQDRLVALISGSNERVADRASVALAKAGPDAVAIFGQAMRSPVRSVQYRAVWGLGQAGGPDAANFLVSLSSHAEVRIRAMALEALIGMEAGDRPGLVAHFAYDDHPIMRRRVAEAYAQEYAPEALDVLARLAEDRDSGIRAAATVALAEQPGGTVLVEKRLRDEVAPIRAEAARVIAAASDDTRRGDLLRHADKVVRVAAFEALQDRLDVGVALYRAMLNESDDALRLQALQRVLASTEASAAAVASEFLADGDGRIQQVAFEALLSRGRLEPQMLIPLADSGTQTMQRKAVEQLIAWGTPQADEVLSQFSQVRDAKTRALVAARLATQPQTWTIAALQRLANDSDADVRRDALKALTQRPEDEAVEMIARFLEDSSASIRKDAATALGRKRDPRTAIALGARSRDTSVDVRKASVKALRLMADDVAAGALVSYLNDSDEIIRRDTVRNLVGIGTPISMGFVGELAQDSRQGMRQLALEALLAEGRRENGKTSLAATELSHFFQDPSRSLQLAAIDAAGQIAHGEAVEGLARLSDESETEVRLVAVDALRRVRDNRAVQALELYRDDSEVAVREGAYKGLAQVGGSQGYELLVAGLDDSNLNVRLSVIESLGELRLGLSVDKLAERLDSADAVEQKAIIEALGQIRSTKATAILVDLAASSKGVMPAIMAKKALENMQQVDPKAVFQGRSPKL